MVSQAPSRSMKEALLPSMKALISAEILRHPDMDVKVSVAACMSELTRITAPDAPYNDEQMKEIFQLIIIAFEKLSCESGRCYSKAIQILDNIAYVKACLLMLDLECDALIVDMFRQFLNTIGSNHPDVVFAQMEYIMTLSIEESEEICPELLNLLLSSVKLDNQNASPLSWQLGERVLKNCSAKLQPCLPEVVKSMSLPFDDYSDIVASICQAAPIKEHMVAEEACPSADNDNSLLRNEDHSLKNKRSLNKVKCNYQIKQHKSTDARSNSDPVNSDAIRSVQTERPAVAKKRGRKPNSLLKPEEGYYNSLTRGRRKPLKEPCLRKNHNNKIDTIVVKEEDRVLSDTEQEHGEELVGCRVKVWWPLDKKFYEGAVSSFDPCEKKHKVLYADGDEELLDLRYERWELIGNISPDIGLHPNLPSAATLSHNLNRPRKKKAKTRSEFSEKLELTASLPKRLGTSTEVSKVEAPKSGSIYVDKSTLVPISTSDATRDEGTKVDPQSKQDKLRYTGRPETQTMRTVLKHTPATSDKLVESDSRSSYTARDEQKSSHEELSRDIAEGEELSGDIGEGKSSESEESETKSIKKRRRLVKGKGFGPHF